MGEVCAWQREWPVQRPWGRYLFQMFKRKSKASAARGMILRDTDDRLCHTCEEGCGPSATTVTSRHRAVLVHTASPLVFIVLQSHPMNWHRSPSWCLLLTEFWPLYCVTLRLGVLAPVVRTAHPPQVTQTHRTPWSSGLCNPRLYRPCHPGYAGNGYNPNRPDQRNFPWKM